MSEAALRTEMEAMKQLWQQAGLNAAGGATGFGKGGGKGNGDERGRALLNRKDFGLVDKFEGNQVKFKNWLRDLLTALGSVDQGLAKETKEMLKARPKIVMDGGAWDIPDDVALDFPIGQSPSNHKKYKGFIIWFDCRPNHRRG